MGRTGNSESSPNSILWLWIPDLRSASLRLSGMTTECEAYDNRISSNRRPSLFSSFFTALDATTSPSLA